jgi:hypothetical protein
LPRQALIWTCAAARRQHIVMHSVCCCGKSTAHRGGPLACLIEAPWLVNGGHGASLCLPACLPAADMPGRPPAGGHRRRENGPDAVVQRQDRGHPNHPKPPGRCECCPIPSVPAQRHLNAPMDSCGFLSTRQSVFSGLPRVRSCTGAGGGGIMGLIPYVQGANAGLPERSGGDAPLPTPPEETPPSSE